MAGAIFEYCYSFITIGALWYALSLSYKASTKKLFIIWLMFGQLFGMFAFCLPYTAYPIPWLGSGSVQLLGLFLFNFVVGLVCAVSYSVIAFYFYNKKIAHNPWWLQVMLFGSFLVLAELIRSILLSGLFYGNGGWVGLNWSGETIGNALSITPFVEYAYFGGAYMLTFLVGSSLLTVRYILKGKNSLLYYTPFIIMTLGVIGIHYLIPVRGPEKETTVVTLSSMFVVPRSSGGEDVNQNFAKHFITLYTGLEKLSSYKPSMILLPEDTQFTKYLVGSIGSEITNLFPATLFVDGDTISQDGKLSNVTIFHTPDNGTSTRAYKQFMFPLNEYIPYSFESVFRFFVAKNDLETFMKDHTYTPLFLPRTYVHDGVRVGTLLCSEIVSFQTIQKLGREKPDIIIHQAQLVLFKRSAIYDAHLRSFSKVTAAQLRTPFVGSVNGLPSYIISPYGSIVDTNYANADDSASFGVYQISKDSISRISP